MNYITIVAAMISLKVPDHAIASILENNPEVSRTIFVTYGLHGGGVIKFTRKWVDDGGFGYEFQSKLYETFFENMDSIHDFLEQKRVAQEGFALILSDLHRKHEQSFPRTKAHQLNQDIRNRGYSNRPDPTQNIKTPPKPTQSLPRRGVRGK